MGLTEAEEKRIVLIAELIAKETSRVIIKEVKKELKGEITEDVDHKITISKKDLRLEFYGGLTMVLVILCGYLFYNSNIKANLEANPVKKNRTHIRRS
jgi:hypothetical protein